MWKAETPESINPQSSSYSQSSGELMNGRIFVFDWINVSQLKHLLGPECIVMVSVDLVMTRSCLIHDRSPAPIIRLLMTLIIPLSRSRHPVQCGHTPGPMVSPRVTGLRLMTNVNILNVKHNVTCCPMPFEWWIVHESQNMCDMCVSDDVKLSPIRKCLMLNDWGLAVFVWPPPG